MNLNCSKLTTGNENDNNKEDSVLDKGKHFILDLFFLRKHSFG